MNPELKLHEEKMTKTISVLREELAAIRAGRANPAVLDKLVFMDLYPFFLLFRRNCSVPSQWLLNSYIQTTISSHCLFLFSSKRLPVLQLRRFRHRCPVLPERSECLYS